MNKKNLLAAFALPLFVAACSSEDVLIESKDNNQYDVAKVDAKFNLGNAESRLATQWGIEAGKDILGFAWLGTEATHGGAVVGMNGLAYQNHPLFAASAGSFQPETSIYVGKYYTYHPYDYSTKSVQAVNFTVENQDMLSSYNDLAKTSIWISPKWTNVTLAGDRYNYDKAGVDQTFNIYPRQMSNYANLFMDYINNNPVTGAPEIKNIKISYLDATTKETISVKEFAYAPKVEAASNLQSGDNDFWADYTLIESTTTASTGSRVTAVPSTMDGVTAVKGAIVLTPSEEYYATGESGRVRYNALPASKEVSAKTIVKIEILTTYGKITYPTEKTNIATNKLMTLDLIAKTADANNQFKAYCDGQVSETGELLGYAATESFVQRLYKTGRFDVDVDFFDAIMDGMHVKDNAELMKMLTFYDLYKKGQYAETGVDLYLDTDANGEFKISKKALALAQKINGSNGTGNVALHVCDLSCGKTVAPKIVVFNEEDAEDENYKEVPTFASVFGSNVDIYLDNQAWTWNSNDYKNTGRVKTIYNRGQLEIAAGTVNAGHSSLNIFNGIENTVQGTIEVKSVANVKINLVNKGGIEIAEGKELLAHGSTFTNEATGLNVHGSIINNGVLGVVEGTNGKIYNYGYIKNEEGAKTYITKNQTDGAKFANKWSSTNKIGVIMLTTKFDNISVSNNTNQGFIKFTWDGGEVYETPHKVGVPVKYNYLIVEDDIIFEQAEEEIMYLEVANTGKEILIVSEDDNNVFNNPLEGFVMQPGAQVNIMEGNTVKTNAAYVLGSRVRFGGTFTYTDLETYLGGANDQTNRDCIVRY